MNRDNAKKLSDVYEPIQPSEDLVRKTEALMRAESQKICSVPRRRPMVLRVAALAACFILVCSAALVYILRASPSDFSGQPGPGLAAAPTERELRMIAQPMMTFELSSDVPPLGELIAGLDVAAMNACGANAGELIVKAVCTGLAEYLPAAPADAGFASVFLSDLVITDVLYAQNAPHDYGDGDKITALLFCYDVALPELPDSNGTTEYLFCLSTADDGNVYAENGTDTLAYSAWRLHSLYPQEPVQ